MWRLDRDMDRNSKRIEELVNELHIMTGGNVERLTVSDSSGRIAKKISIEYDIQDPVNN